MSGRVLALLVLLVAPALAGCVGMTSETEVFGTGRKQTLHIEPGKDPRVPAAADVTRAADDPTAPPLFHDGAPATAIAIAVKERERDRADPPGATSLRYPCGGAVIAIGEGAPDPRTLLMRGAGADDLPPVTYEWSRMVTDGWGREWTTDRYSVTQETTGRTWRIWVANVGGDLAFTADDGLSSCAPFTYGSKPFNTIVHAWGHEGMMDVYFSSLQRFPAPESRAWVLGPVD